MIRKSELTTTIEPSPRDIFEAILKVAERPGYQGPTVDDIYPPEVWLQRIQDTASRWKLGCGSFDEVMIDTAVVIFAAIASTERQRLKRKPPLKLGQEEGDPCNRMGCTGTMEWRRPAECTCHIAPPCGYCTDAPLICTKCAFQFRPGDEKC